MNRRSLLGRAGMGMLGVLALGASLFGIVPGCSGTEAAPDPCETAYAGLCGGECFDDSGCADGLYCGSSGSCTAECTPTGQECGFDVACSAKGRCDGEPGDGFGVGPGTDGQGCADVNVTFDRVTPTVMLLIDQSGSMTDNFGNGNRWDVLADALMNEQSGFVKNLEGEIRFGLALYTSHDGNEGGACPLITKVDAKIGNFEAIRAMYAAADPEDETPTGDSIRVVAEQLKGVKAPGPKIIVLATDGMPDTCEEPNPQNGEQEALQAAQAAYAEGIKTVVLSVGPELSQDHLQEMANAGAGMDVNGGGDAPYYQALDQDELIDAFQKIIGGVRDCTFTLDGKVTGDPGAGTVLLDGQPLPYNDPNGWQLNNPSTIEIVGESCQKIQDGEHNLKVTFPCGGVIVDVE